MAEWGTRHSTYLPMRLNVLSLKPSQSILELITELEYTQPLKVKVEGLSSCWFSESPGRRLKKRPLNRLLCFKGSSKGYWLRDGKLSGPEGRRGRERLTCSRSPPTPYIAPALYPDSVWKQLDNFPCRRTLLKYNARSAQKLTKVPKESTLLNVYIGV